MVRTMKTKMQDAQQYLVNHGIRPSIQRLAVMEYLLNHRTHPTADEIYLALSDSIPTLSKMTVYNTLNMLSDSGAIMLLDIDCRNKRYDGVTSFHAHFMCDKCSTIEDIFFDDGEKYTSVPFEGTIDDVQLLLKGKCKKCAKTDMS